MRALWGRKDLVSQTQRPKVEAPHRHSFLSLCRKWPLWFLFFMNKMNIFLPCLIGLHFGKNSKNSVYTPFSLSSVCHIWKSVIKYIILQNILSHFSRPINETSIRLSPFFFLSLDPSSRKLKRVFHQILFISVGLFQNLHQGLPRKPSLPSGNPSSFFVFVFSMRWA